MVPDANNEIAGGVADETPVGSIKHGINRKGIVEKQHFKALARGRFTDNFLWQEQVIEFYPALHRSDGARVISCPEIDIVIDTVKKERPVLRLEHGGKEHQRA